MAELLKDREVSSVRLIDIKFSEDELEVLTTALNVVLETYDDQTLDNIFGADRDEIEAVLYDLEQVIASTQLETSLD
jgi:hypothetical protein